MLQNMADPTAATNLAGMGLNQGVAMGGQKIASQQNISGYDLAGTEAQGQAIADTMRGMSNIASNWQPQSQGVNQEQSAEEISNNLRMDYGQSPPPNNTPDYMGGF